MDLFIQLKWLVNPKAVTTIAAGERTYPIRLGAPAGTGDLAYTLPRYDGPPPMAERPARGDDGMLLALDAQANRDTVFAQYAQSGANGLAGFPTTSNMWVIGKQRARGAKAIMLNGPQFGWFNPGYTSQLGSGWPSDGQRLGKLLCLAYAAMGAMPTPPRARRAAKGRSPECSHPCASKPSAPAAPPIYPAQTPAPRNQSSPMSPATAFSPSRVTTRIAAVSRIRPNDCIIKVWSPARWQG
uniref:penicillin acylase family protein n=1 Tax=Cupriavidus ulmosensis TaxID=3065913 RepID=UPI0030190199